jgi:nucleotide-binding universal stress UspA family protein
MFERIAVAIVDDEIAGSLLRVASALAEPLGARVALVYVVDLARVSLAAADPTGAGALTAAELLAEEEQLGRTVLERAAARFPHDRVETLLREGVPAEEVVAVAQEWRADLILVGTHRRGGLARLVLGSVAEGVLRRAPCPVLVVPKGAVTA